LALTGVYFALRIQLRAQLGKTGYDAYVAMPHWLLALRDMAMYPSMPHTSPQEFFTMYLVIV
jgi:hypothetical protein